MLAALASTSVQPVAFARPVPRTTSAAENVDEPAVIVDISEEARAAAEAREDEPEGSGGPEPTGELEPEQLVQVAKLKATDAKVRAHEQAHAAADSGLAGSPRYSYQTGPDGQRYAIGGSVSIDTSPAGSPDESINKARQVRAAALAPADPSGKDRAVAAAAAQMEMRALGQKQAEQAKETAKEEPRTEAAKVLGQEGDANDLARSVIFGDSEHFGAPGQGIPAEQPIGLARAAA